MTTNSEEVRCTHEWETCPVHGSTEGLPRFRTVLTCIYGGADLKDGGEWDEQTSAEVAHKIVDKLDGLL